MRFMSLFSASVEAVWPQPALCAEVVRKCSSVTMTNPEWRRPQKKASQHGQWGEDGCVQGMLEILGLPYTHSGVLASSLAMDKERAKVAFAQEGIPVAKSEIVSLEAAARDHAMEPPYVIKPNAQGSSVGVFLVREGDNRPPEALTSAQWSLGDTVMARDHLAGKELTIGRYYLRRGQHIAAINRFRNVVERYQTTSHVPEALHRLVESYMALGIQKEAQTAAAVLGYNFPGEEWYQDSYALLKEEDLEPAVDNRSWIARAWGSVF